MPFSPASPIVEGINDRRVGPRESPVAALVASVTQTVGRVRAAQQQFGAGPSANPAKLAQVNALADMLNTQAVRYGKPGLQAHIQYMARLGMTVDQKVGRDAIERYGVLRKDLDAVITELDQIMR